MLVNWRFLIDLLHVKITGLDAKQISELKQIPPSLSTPLKLLNGALLVLLLLLPAAIFSYLAYPNPFQYLGLIKPYKIKFWILSIVIIGLALPVSSLIEQACRHISFSKNTKPSMPYIIVWPKRCCKEINPSI